MSESEKIQTKVRLEGSTDKLMQLFGNYRTVSYVRVSKDGKVRYEERSPLTGTKELARLAASAPGYGVEFEYTTTRSDCDLNIAHFNLTLDRSKSTPLRPVIIISSWYSSREEHYRKVGKIKDTLIDNGFLPQGGQCQVTMTIDC